MHDVACQMNNDECAVVLADYERASQAFDAKVLQTVINEYPQHADALRRYAHVQLTFVPATTEEIEREAQEMRRTQ